jgi:hypothetical protein
MIRNDRDQRADWRCRVDRDRADRRPARVRPGTFAPLRRASLKPMAIACLRLFTVRPELLFSVPRLRRRIAQATVF